MTSRLFLGRRGMRELVHVLVKMTKSFFVELFCMGATLSISFPISRQNTKTQKRKQLCSFTLGVDFILYFNTNITKIIFLSFCM